MNYSSQMQCAGGFEALFSYKIREVNNNMTVAFFLTSDLIIQTIATDRAHNSASVVILLMPLNT